MISKDGKVRHLDPGQDFLDEVDADYVNRSQPTHPGRPDPPRTDLVDRSHRGEIARKVPPGRYAAARIRAEGFLPPRLARGAAGVIVTKSG
jgi:hypothetical protein